MDQSLTLPQPIIQALQTLHLAGFVGPALAVLALAGAASHFLAPYVPVATTASPVWYRILYGALRLFAGNYGNASPRG